MITTIEYKIGVREISSEEEIDKIYYKLIKKLNNRVKKGHNIIIKTCSDIAEHRKLKDDIETYIKNLEDSKEVLKRVKFVPYLFSTENNSYTYVYVKFELETKSVQQVHLSILKLLKKDKNVILDFNGVETLTEDIIFKLIGELMLVLNNSNKIDNLNNLKFLNTNDYLKKQFNDLYWASSIANVKPDTIKPTYI